MNALDTWFTLFCLNSMAIAGLYSFVVLITKSKSMKQWIQVAATVKGIQRRSETEAGHELSMNIKIKEGYRIKVRYEYECEGVRYIGDKINVLDYVGLFFLNYDSQVFRRLQRAVSGDGGILVWVNPKKLSESVVDRRSRPGVVLISLLLAVVGASGSYYLARSMSHWTILVTLITAGLLLGLCSMLQHRRLS